MMVLKHLQSIRSKEDEARSRVRGAENKVGALVEQAGEDGERFLADVRGEAAERAKALMTEARTGAESEIAAIRSGNAKDLAALSVVARKNRERALEIIMKMFHEGF